MKKILKLIIISIIFFTSSSVLAFNSSIEISDDINVLYYDKDNIKIKISDNLKSNNSSISYEFISASEEEITNFENKNTEAFENLSKCLDNNTQETCINNYNNEKDKISSKVPGFNNNWNKIKGDGTTIFSIPKYYDNYYLWVKALDNNGKEIYALFYETASLDQEAVITGVQTSVRSSASLNSVVAMASIMFSAGGMICFIAGIAYIIKYGNFKFKFNY